MLTKYCYGLYCDFSRRLLSSRLSRKKTCQVGHDLETLPIVPYSDCRWKIRNRETTLFLIHSQEMVAEEDESNDDVRMRRWRGVLTWLRCSQKFNFAVFFSHDVLDPNSVFRNKPLFGSRFFVFFLVESLLLLLEFGIVV